MTAATTATPARRFVGPGAPSRAYDQVRFHRGTRGFAAFLTILNGFAVLAFGVAVVPSAGIGTLGASLSIVAIAAGLAHFVGVYGLIRGRAWSGTLVAYLAAAGIGASIFAMLLIARAGESILGAGDVSTLGYFAWMIGMWSVAAAFGIKPFRSPSAPRSTSVLAMPTARIVEPVAAHRRVVLGAAAA